MEECVIAVFGILLVIRIVVMSVNAGYGIKEDEQDIEDTAW